MNITNQLNNFWSGKVALWISYWIVGELLNSFILIIIFNVELKYFNNSNFISNILFLSFNDLHIINKIIIFIWSIFITVGIWRSAENYNGKVIWTILTLIVLSYRIFILKEIFY